MPDRGGVITGVVIVVIIALLLGGVLLAGRTGARGARRRREAVLDADVETLRYRVPNGQDPAMLLAALTHQGFAAVAEPVREGKDVVVSCPDGRERERDRVRTTIQDASDMGGSEWPRPGRVTFLDE
jgi:hypothetical protein